MSRTITLKPTWRGLLPALLAIAQDGSAEGRRTAVDELERMAEAADRWNDHCGAAPAVNSEGT